MEKLNVNKKRKNILIAKMLSIVLQYGYAAEEFHTEIAHERNLDYPIYDIPVRMDLVFDPLDLLVWSRFDIIAKYIYAYYREMGFQTDWALRLYTEHLRIWGFQEWDGSKQNLEDFLAAFHEIIDSIKWNGFNFRISKIRIDNRRIPVEGSHRIGTCLLFKPKMICYYDPKGIPPRATMSSSMFFRKYTKYVKEGLAEKYLDDMALYYTKLKKNTHIVIVFPIAQGHHDEIRRILRMYGNIVYEKYVTLTEKGQLHFIRELYQDAAGIGYWEDNFADAQQEVYYRFKTDENDANMCVWLTEFNTDEQRENCRQMLKMVFDNNEYAIYCSQNHRETVRLGRILFVPNSIVFLNVASTKKLQQINSCLKEFKNMMHDNNIDEESVCIVGDAVHAIYGGYDCSMVKFICAQHINVPTIYADCLRHDNAERVLLDDILFNPENHFYYKNIKWSLKLD